MEVLHVSPPFDGQKPGTSGLRVNKLAIPVINGFEQIVGISREF